MNDKLRNSSKTITSDQLHNKNCYSYLNHIIPGIPPSVLSALPEKLQNSIRQFTQNNGAYKRNFAYGDLYTDLLSYTEDHLEPLIEQKREALLRRLAQIEHQMELMNNPEVMEKHGAMFRSLQEPGDPEEKIRQIDSDLQALDDFIFSFYHNDNDILDQSFQAIKHIPLSHTPSDSGIEKSVASLLQDKGSNINKGVSPSGAGSMRGRFTAMVADNFKPQHTTSLATVRKYEYQQHGKDHIPTEYRFGTQGQRHNDVPRAAPLFEYWLQVQKRRHRQAQLPPNEEETNRVFAKWEEKLSDDPMREAYGLQPVVKPTKITHVYFNNLGLDRDDLEGKKEQDLTLQLHQLENQHSNTAVITLPADKGLMSKGEFEKTDPSLKLQDVYDEFLHIASQDGQAQTEVKDFYISKAIRKLLFTEEDKGYSEEYEQERIRDLLDKSFTATGIDLSDPDLQISPAQRQAVWFHFNKFELPNYIIQTLRPESINFSCKDAIDRGGVSSAYYNLVKSFATDTPLSREEFDKALHAAPAMVKARGMNHHLKMIWNAVDAYVNANYQDIYNNPQKAWLIAWRDFNCPHARVSELLQSRVAQNLQLLEEMKLTDPQNKAAIEIGIKILQNISQQTSLDTSGKRLLLETVSRTPDIIQSPKPGDIEKYEDLADKLTVNYPVLKIIGGMMKVLGGVLLYPFSQKKGNALIDSGISTFQSGSHAFLRGNMAQDMKNMKASLASLKEADPEKDNLDEPLPVIKVH
ncbi:hypothetical protein [Legionella spiritensis]|uniref:hypothetical protein n=1 Tax=Legionella spiritensis TaxID=452 RepID=UPI000F6CE25E|nr:hypothetical protein [Legionella spiritensis]VEG90410.1 Uncharacterised protein [Legionella spiritensis]